MTYWNKIVFCIRFLLGRVTVDLKGKFITPGDSVLLTKTVNSDMQKEASKYVIAAAYIAGMGKPAEFFSFMEKINLDYKPNSKT